MSLTLYTTPSCMQCTATKKEFDRLGLSYDVIDLTEDAAAMELVREMGYRQAPVIVAGDDHWSGFRPDKIMGLPRPAEAA